MGKGLISVKYEGRINTKMDKAIERTFKRFGYLFSGSHAVCDCGERERVILFMPKEYKLSGEKEK